MARLGDVCSFFSGTGFPNAYQGQKTGKYPFYKVGDISKNVLLGNRELISSDNYIDDDTVQAIKGTVLPPKTVVFAKIGEALRLNRRAITNCYCLVDNNAMGILADNTVLDELYFYYFMCSVDLQHYCESTTVPSVRKTRIAEIEIPLPSLEEQRRIATVLDKVSDLITKRRAQLDKLDLLVKAWFVEMFGDPSVNTRWSTMKLYQLGELNRGVSKHRPRNDPRLLGGTYPLIQTGDVSNSGLYILSFSSTYSKLGLEQSRLWKSGTLCITIAANIAQTSILTFDACFPDSVVGFVPNDNTNSVFIHYWFSFFQKILEEQAPQVAQKNINLKILSDLDVIVPPYTLQEDFSAFVGQVEKSKLTIQQSLDKLEMLKKALMQQYFG